jgi:hypothetical protein
MTYDPLKIYKHDLPVIKKDHVVFFGCSYTNGHGLSDPDLNWTNLFSKSIKKNQLNLAISGTNNYRNFDVFSQLEFGSDQNVIVFEITQLSRLQWYNQGLDDVMIQWDHCRALVPVYNDHFLVFELLKNLRNFLTICRLKKLRPIVWNIAKPGMLNEIFENYLSQYPEYVYLDNSIGGVNSYRVDNALDGAGKPVGHGHPGPESHKLIAQKLLAHYNKLYQESNTQ